MSLEGIAGEVKGNPPIQIMESAEAEWEKYKEFFDHKCKYTEEDSSVGLSSIGAIGGRITYKFTNTTVGTIVKVACACGKEADITDYRMW